MADNASTQQIEDCLKELLLSPNPQNNAKSTARHGDAGKQTIPEDPGIVSSSDSARQDSDVSSLFDSPYHQNKAVEGARPADSQPSASPRAPDTGQPRVLKNKKRAKKKKKTADVLVENLKKAGQRDQNSAGQRDQNSAGAVDESGAQREGAEEALCYPDLVRVQDDYYHKDILGSFEVEYIFPLRKKSMKFPTAKFFCRLCEYHCFDPEHCNKHMKDNRHQRLKKIKVLDVLLRALPSPSPTHIQALDQLIDGVADTHGLTEEDLQLRTAAKERIEAIIQRIDKDLHLTMYGSSLNSFGIKSSNLNLDFSTNVEPKYLKEAYIKLKEDKSGYISDLRSDFSAKVPCVNFRVPSVDLWCQLGINNAGSHKTSALLAVYCDVDPRVRRLVVAFRYLAKLCKMDRQEEGTLPAYVFQLMTVFFLQQCKPPVLPVLHQIEKPQSKDPEMENWYFKDLDRLGSVWRSKNTQTVGRLWLDLLRFYSVTFDINQHVISLRQASLLSRQEKKWASKKLAIEDPFVRRRNVARTVSHSQVFEYVAERIRAAYQYFGVPQTGAGALYQDMDGLTAELALRKALETKHGEKEAVPGTDALENEPDKTAPCSDGCDSRKKLDFGENTKSNSEEAEVEVNIGEVDESLGQDQLNCEVVPKPQSFDSVEEFAKYITGNIVKNALDQIHTTKLKESSYDLKNTDANSQDKSAEEKVNAESVSSDTSKEISEDNVSSQSPETIEDKEGHATDENKIDSKQKLCSMDLREADFKFRFDEDALSDSKGPAIMCSICQQEGHLKIACPEENLPPPEPLAPLTPQYRKLLNKVIESVPDDFAPSVEEQRMRGDVVRELEDAIQGTHPKARLEVFGSSCNGFGFRGSDLDLCLTFDDTKTPENIDSVAVIEQLSKVLKKHRNLYNVFPITTAKVPIVKFKHRPSNLEGDISLYNTLAIENTRMLQLYCELDWRVRTIGYTMKVFAKICDICDASKGSLSSYAYILLVIHYLQQREPPVIPVLQELYPKGKDKPENIVDGWNSWFCKDISAVRRLWPHQENRETVADLWVGLLRYYTEDFNVTDSVITIRQEAPLTKFEKLWNNRTIAIEDPFDLGHNLGGGLSRKMNMYIIRTFRNGRKVFGVSKNGIPNGFNSMADYLFNPNMLTDSLPPSDRNCHVCGKIGHFAKECPVAEARKESEKTCHKCNKVGHLVKDCPMRDQTVDQRHQRQHQQHQQQALKGRRNDHSESPRPNKSRERSTPQKIPLMPGHGHAQRSGSFGHTPPHNSHHSPHSGTPPGFHMNYQHHSASPTAYHHSHSPQYNRSHSQPNIKPLMVVNTQQYDNRNFGGQYQTQGQGFQQLGPVPQRLLTQPVTQYYPPSQAMRHEQRHDQRHEQQPRHEQRQHHDHQRPDHQRPDHQRPDHQRPDHQRPQFRQQQQHGGQKLPLLQHPQDPRGTSQVAQRMPQNTHLQQQQAHKQHQQQHHPQHFSAHAHNQHQPHNNHQHSAHFPPSQSSGQRFLQELQHGPSSVGHSFPSPEEQMSRQLQDQSRAGGQGRAGGQWTPGPAQRGPPEDWPVLSHPTGRHPSPRGEHVQRSQSEDHSRPFGQSGTSAPSQSGTSAYSRPPMERAHSDGQTYHHGNDGSQTYHHGNKGSQTYQHGDERCQARFMNALQPPPTGENFQNFSRGGYQNEHYDKVYYNQGTGYHGNQGSGNQGNGQKHPQQNSYHGDHQNSYHGDQRQTRSNRKRTKQKS